MTLAYFCVTSLSLIPGSVVSSAADAAQSALDVLFKPEQKRAFVDWIYDQQLPAGGFRGSDALSKTDSANVVHSYTAILSLVALGDDLSRLGRQSLLSFVKSCQTDDGSFKQFPSSPEQGDPRATYAAFAIASMLNDWSCIDVNRSLAFLRSCQTYEGGFATRPCLEAQGGTTYCAIASYALSNSLHELPNRDQVVRWLVQRQVPPSEEQLTDEDDDDADTDEDIHGQNSAENDAAKMASTARGFQGRTGKDPDACYSFWCTAALKILNEAPLIDEPAQRQWLLACQHSLYGGIARQPFADPDVYHTYLALAALSLSNQDQLADLEPAWNCSHATAARLQSLKAETISLK